MAATTEVPRRERRFYLEQFAGRTMVVAEQPRPDGATSDAVDRCITDLVAEGVQVVHLQGGGRVAHWAPDDAGIVSAWRQLRRHGRMRISLPDDADVLGTAVRLAARLRAFKLVLTSTDEPRPQAAARPDSFVTIAPTEAGPSGMRALAADALAGGVQTVNVCHPDDIAEELLTYAGAGTCYSLQDYCRVERVGIDDYHQVTQLIERGVEEGYLKPRDPDAVARLIVNGLGAMVGDHHLAGFAALLTEPYADRRMGELCGLSTISRFAGGGVGGQLVAEILRSAARDGLQGVFACTTSESAAGFFRRLGFVEVPQSELPEAKWADYDGARRDGLRAFMHLLTMI